LFGTGAVDDLIRRARRRYVQNLLVKQAVRAASAVLAGLILLLVAGTQILDWRWIAVLVAAGVAAGLRTLPRQIPSRYKLAQRIDHRLSLADSLSTALFFAPETAARRIPEDLRRAQREQAERLAAGVDAARAVPYTVPRSIYAMAVLGLAASSLFALRYGVARTLDLRPPLTSLVFDAFHFVSEPQAAETKKRVAGRAPTRLDEFGIPLGQDAANLPGLAPEALSTGAAEKDARAPASLEAVNRSAQGSERGEGPGEGQKASVPGERDSSGPSASAGAPSGPPPGDRQAEAARHESNSLLDKFRDAMANLMSRLKQQPRAAESQSAANSAQKPGNGRDRPEKGAERSGKQAEGSPIGPSPGDPQDEGEQQAQNGPGKQGGPDPQQASSKGQTGIGKSDGSKDIRAAEQLAAMGKISEIIGKRSQNLSGEMMVEVASGKQDLRTAYSRQSAPHADSGGEIHRDEIPLAYQRYVQQYFEQVRKAAPPAPAKPR
jgi:hypothetical protein